MSKVERSGVICGTEKRPPHPCGVRSVTSRRTRSSSCWQDLGVSTFATTAWIAVNRSCRKSERSSQFSLAEKRYLIVFPLPHSQTKPGSKGLRNAEQLDRHPSSQKRACIASQSLCPRKPIVRTLGTGKGCRCDSEAGCGGRFDLDLDALMAHQ